MNKLKYLLIFIFFFACAVQGPISGGPEDLEPPELIEVFPENFSTNINPKQKITLIFNEMINPASINESIRINNNEFGVKVRGKKVIVYPKDSWSSELILDIYLKRNLRDYQNNSIVFPINLFYSLGDSMPSNRIYGKIFDIKNSIDNYNSKDIDARYEIGLFSLADNERKLIKTIESNKDLEFSFDIVKQGAYSIAAVEGELIDIELDTKKRRYSIASDNIYFDSKDSTAEVSLNISGPLSKENLSSINFINQYYVNYIFTDNTIKEAIIDTIYNNFEDNDFSGDSLNVSLPMSNDFEKYFTDSFSFTVPEIPDTLSPTIRNTLFSDGEVTFEFSEPVARIYESNIFYLLIDSSKVYLDMLSTNENVSLKNSVTISTKDFPYKDSLSIFNIYIEKDLITDLYKNSLQDSLKILNINSQLEVKQKTSSRVEGSVSYVNSTDPIVVALYNTKDLSKQLVLVDENYNFSFSNLEPGFYFIQSHENYSKDMEIAYPYFPGNWVSSERSSKFSDIIGPIEVRVNWDVEDIDINFK